MRSPQSLDMEIRLQILASKYIKMNQFTSS